MDWIGSVLASIITGVLALIGVVVTSTMSNRQLEHKLEINQAVTETKLDNLTKEVMEHNSGVQKIPVLEERVNTLEQRVSNVENKLSKG